MTIPSSYRNGLFKTWKRTMHPSPLNSHPPPSRVLSNARRMLRHGVLAGNFSFNLKKGAAMRIQRNSSSLITSGLLSFLLFISFSNAKADDANTAATPVEGQANTLTASGTAPGVSELPEVKVTAHGIDQAAAFDEMHDSLNKVNVLSQDQINQTPAKSVAQAAEQLPGVGLIHDTSEPRFITIRGTDPNLDILTFNETIIPSYDEASRSVDRKSTRLNSSHLGI